MDDRQEGGRGFRLTDGCIHREEEMEGGGRGREVEEEIAILYAPS